MSRSLFFRYEIAGMINFGRRMRKFLYPRVQMDNFTKTIGFTAK